MTIRLDMSVTLDGDETRRPRQDRLWRVTDAKTTVVSQLDDSSRAGTPNGTFNGSAAGGAALLDQCEVNVRTHCHGLL